MKAATIHDIKQELGHLPPAELMELCLRLARFKKENKELLTYLLFEAFDEAAYIRLVKEEMDQQFSEINTAHIYFAKKSLRKILRNIGKYIRYTGSRQVEVELLLYFCGRLKEMGLAVNRNTVIINIFQAQLKKIGKALDTMHEDLQYEYRRELEAL